MLRRRAGADGAPARGASRSQRELERLAVWIDRVVRLGFEHQAQRIDYVLARLLTGPTLANRAGHLLNLRHDPTFSTVGVADGEAQSVAHCVHGTH